MTKSLILKQSLKTSKKLLIAYTQWPNLPPDLYINENLDIFLKKLVVNRILITPSMEKTSAKIKIKYFGRTN